MRRKDDRTRAPGALQGCPSARVATAQTNEETKCMQAIPSKRRPGASAVPSRGGKKDRGRHAATRGWRRGGETRRSVRGCAHTLRVGEARSGRWSSGGCRVQRISSVQQLAI